jgi:hypothetical protein
MYGLQAQWLFDPTTDMVAMFDQFLDGLRPAPSLSNRHPRENS